MNQHQQVSYNLPYTIQFAQQDFLRHAAWAEHYERLKIANANNSTDYYRYAELQYYHKSRALHFKGYFSASSVM